MPSHHFEHGKKVVPVLHPMHKLFAVYLETGQIGSAMLKYGQIMFKQKGVPRIIDMEKEYREFTVEIDGGEKKNGKYLLISEYVEGSVCVTLVIKAEEAFDRFSLKVLEKRKNENKARFVDSADIISRMCDCSSKHGANSERGLAEDRFCEETRECEEPGSEEYRVICKEKGWSRKKDEETGVKQITENNERLNSEDKCTAIKRTKMNSEDKCTAIKRTKMNSSPSDQFCTVSGKIGDAKFTGEDRFSGENVKKAPSCLEEEGNGALQQVDGDSHVYSDINAYHSSDCFKTYLRDLLPRSFEVLGRTMILNLSNEQRKYKKEIAEYFFELKSCKTIFLKNDVVKETYRTTEYELLLGEDKKDVVYTENAIRFEFNICDVYFNSKLSGAREQLVAKFRKNDVVADLFCGIGPISTQALKKGCYVIANDINPKAIEYFKNIVKINGIAANYEVYNEDAKDVISNLVNREINHFVFNLPELSIYFIEHVKVFAKSELHCYFFCRKNRDVIAYLQEEIGLVVPRGCIKECRNVAPSKLYYYMNVKVKDLQWLDSDPHPTDKSMEA
ncbi:hypothetical protein VCUG_00940 [Vavraia culicis subsp. floridensis]|uniref:SAM-dependent methyltransferase TRM5/TYW2-type domain-containing protein n=1 Tax=Vavraia culicis (isolate floridensis) TaxID=948595 RepID=L2GW71_VAVCU|nr:uncharacterized protein VCUG_00940 [Vavraia culicis subsp. floridensis]ELA47617.1 hypothetical protein VCUG_00940 [Vavraia culicis subsp. floridensis]